jgi:hypothetical protein
MSIPNSEHLGTLRFLECEGSSKILWQYLPSCFSDEVTEAREAREPTQITGNTELALIIRCRLACELLYTNSSCSHSRRIYQGPLTYPAPVIA